MIKKSDLITGSQIVKNSEIGLNRVHEAFSLTRILYDTSVDQIKTNGMLPFPTAFILDEKHCLVLDITQFMQAEETKDNLALLLKNMASNPNILAIALAYVAWVEESEESKLGSSIQTRRLESVVVHGEWRYKDDYLVFGRVLRGKDQKVLDVIKVLSVSKNISGRFSNLFIPDPMPGEMLN